MISLPYPVTIQQPPFTDPNTNKVVNPLPMTLENLSIIFIDNEESRSLSAQIKYLPTLLTLFENDTYSNLGDYKKSTLEQRILQILGDNPQSVLQSLFPRTLEQDPNGPGSILSDMIKSIGINSSPTCSCRRHAIEMNTNGVEWCQNNIDTIVGWLREEATKRKLPFMDSLAKLIVQRAINKSKRLLKNAKQI